MMKKISHPIAAVLLMLLCGFTTAQDEGMSYTVGTTHSDGASQDWAYLLWQATSPDQLANSRFGIYAKAGDAGSIAPYTRLGETTLDANPGVLQAHLDNSVNMGQDLALLEDNLNQMFEGLIDANGSLSLADKLSVALQGAQMDTDLYGQMLFMGRTHVAVNLSMGLAWAEPIAGLTTYEIRELDPLTGGDGRVLGRVTLDPAGGPVVLPAPGDLYQVTRDSGKGHLNASLRWATPDNLRRLDPLQTGFNVYRMDAAFATGNGYDSSPPTPATMAALVAGNPDDVVRVNTAPALSTGDYTNANVANSSDDTAFIVDDNQRFFGGEPFEACTEYYYFVSARDVLARDGELSAGLHVTICDRFPPSQPSRVSVGNDYRYNQGTNTGDQRLLVTWKQNDEEVDNKRAAAYYVYRWDSATEYLAYANDPYQNLIAGPINHVPGEDELSYRDDQGAAPAMPGDANRTYWYTVRAVDEGDCNTCTANFSGNSAPTYGVLRDREGPAGPDGTIGINCAEMYTVYKEEYDLDYQELGWPLNDLKIGEIPDLRGQVEAVDDCEENALTITQSPAPFTPVNPGNYALTFTVSDPSGNSTSCAAEVYVEAGRGDEYVYIFRARRNDNGPAWAEFYLNNTDPAGLLARVNFANGSNVADYVYRVPVGTTPGTVYCRMGSVVGAVSDFASKNVSAVPAVNTAHVVVWYGTLSTNLAQVPDCGPHIAVNPGDGSINPITGTISTTPTTRQWKLYRRVDDGELTLLGVGEATHPATVAWTDDTMPINATRICYFAQLFDEHGNASPMVRLGCTRTTGTGGLPMPMLTELKAVGDETNPQMKIRWFSEAESVERFQVWISPESGSLPDPFSDKLSADTAPTPNLAAVALPGGSVDKDFRVFNSSRVGGPDFAAVPLYEVTVPITPGDTYTVFIKCMDATNGTGPASNPKQFEWAVTNVGPAPLGPDVPWPARPDAPVTQSGFDRVTARQILMGNGFNGVGIRVGELSIYGRSCLMGDRENPFFTPGGEAPATHLYSSTADGDSIMSFAIYRRQVANALFPTVSNDIVQVSPLLEQVAFNWGVSPQFGTYGALLQDPFFAVLPVSDDFQSPSCQGVVPDMRNNFTYEDCSGGVTVTQVPAPGTIVWAGTHVVTITATDSAGNSTTTQTTFSVTPPTNPGPVPYEIYALDTQPVVVGAKYRYLMVRFAADGEARQVIPVDEIEVESAL